MAAIEAADVPFLRRRRKVNPPEVRAQDSTLDHAQIKLDDLKQRYTMIEAASAVVTVRLRPRKSQP